MHRAKKKHIKNYTLERDSRLQNQSSCMVAEPLIKLLYLTISFKSPASESSIHSWQ